MFSSKLFYNRQKNLLNSVIYTSIITILSRIIGLIRDIIIAQKFGTLSEIDIFYIVFRIPNFMRRLFIDGAFSQAFIPIFITYKKKNNIFAIREFISRILGQLIFILSILVILGIVESPLIIYIIAPGFKNQNFNFILAVKLLRLIFPCLMFISLTAIFGALLNSYGYFFIPSMTPIILNISLIISSLYLSSLFQQPVISLVFGVIFAGIFQILFHLPLLYKKNLLIKPKLYWNDIEVKNLLKLMIPSLFGISIAQINFIIDSIFTSFLPNGSISWLYYTDRLTSFPLGVFSVAISIVILPNLSKNSDEKQREKFSNILDWGLQLIFLIGIPSSIGLIMYSTPLIATLFTYGKFSINDLLQTKKSVIALSSGIPAFMTIKILTSGFYAYRNIKTPVKIGIITMIINSICCISLIKIFSHTGIAIASSISGYINVIMLFYSLQRKKIYKTKIKWIKFFVKLFIANFGIIIFLYSSTKNTNYWIYKSVIEKSFIVSWHIFITIIIYFSILYILKIRLNQFYIK